MRSYTLHHQNISIIIHIINFDYIHISMTDASIQLIIDLHKNNLRQGPGSDVDTLKALQYMHLDKEYTYRIADIGCGTGAQTLALATAIKSSITAVDLFPEFLDILGQRATSL